jgi:hypothetical protein
MSNEAQVRASLQVRKGNLTYISQPTSFLASVNTANPIGPTPGSFNVPNAGIDVDLSKLTAKGGLARIGNNEAPSAPGFITYGIKDLTTGYFYPVHDIYPGENYIVRISQFIGEEETGTGTFTPGHTAALHMKAEGVASAVGIVEAFDP